jgi:hypothetical protein
MPVWPSLDGNAKQQYAAKISGMASGLAGGAELSPARVAEWCECRSEGRRPIAYTDPEIVILTEIAKKGKLTFKLPRPPRPPSEGDAEQLARLRRVIADEQAKEDALYADLAKANAAGDTAAASRIVYKDIPKVRGRIETLESMLPASAPPVSEPGGEPAPAPVGRKLGLIGRVLKRTPPEPPAPAEELRPPEGETGGGLGPPIGPAVTPEPPLPDEPTAPASSVPTSSAPLGDGTPVPPPTPVFPDLGMTAPSEPVAEPVHPELEWLARIRDNVAGKPSASKLPPPPAAPPRRPIETDDDLRRELDDIKREIGGMKNDGPTDFTEEQGRALRRLIAVLKEYRDGRIGAGGPFPDVAALLLAFHPPPFDDQRLVGARLVLRSRWSGESGPETEVEATHYFGSWKAEVRP